ncbi:MAG TPA: glycoside hydrolase family 13 protein [Bacteroidota bacterium]|nr:glycoside hydrolase family 13 protein [Bacteroidota bacterium]
MSVGVNTAVDHTSASTIPSWVRHAIIYQIFPERFENGDRSNDPPNTQPWGTKPTGGSFFGGDLEGVLNRLPYLTDLGITTIYFNPVFSASSNHKYNATDYLKIDPAFGTNDLFKTLVDTCHKAGIRILIDGVFNHVGTAFFAFVDVKKNGAASRYAEWFNIFSYPVSDPRTPNYEGWWGYGSLPKLMVAHPDVQRYLFDVARYWTGLGIDGWRLDVPNDVPHAFWKEWRKVVRSVNPECYIVGELWQDASPWLKGDEFDATMNYRFRDACVDFFAHKTTTGVEFQKSLAATRALYSEESNDAMMNLIGSHDTERFLTMCKGDVHALRLAALFQMTYPGAPTVYYGDEVGMEGGKDPDCRRTMIWDQSKWDKDLHAYYRSLIALRKKYEALRTGAYAALPVPEDLSRCVAFERTLGSERFIIAINDDRRKAALSFTVSKDLRSVNSLVDGVKIDVRSGQLSITLQPRDACIIQC